MLEFYILPTYQPVLSMRQLRHAKYSFAWADDLTEGMQIKLPDGELFEKMLQHDVPRIFVANVLQANGDAVNVTADENASTPAASTKTKQHKRKRTKSNLPVLSEDIKLVE